MTRWICKYLYCSFWTSFTVKDTSLLHLIRFITFLCFLLPILITCWRTSDGLACGLLNYFLSHFYKFGSFFCGFLTTPWSCFSNICYIIRRCKYCCPLVFFPFHGPSPFFPLIYILWWVLQGQMCFYKFNSSLVPNLTTYCLHGSLKMRYPIDLVCCSWNKVNYLLVILNIELFHLISFEYSVPHPFVNCRDKWNVLYPLGWVVKINVHNCRLDE